MSDQDGTLPTAEQGNHLRIVASQRTAERVSVFDSEDEFISAFRRRETAAIEEVCQRHLARMRLVLLRVLGRDGELDDVLHEVVVRAIDAAPRFRGASPQLRGWLTSIAVNTGRELIRRRTRFRRFFSTDLEAMEDATAQLASVEEIRAIRQTYLVLDKLPTDERIAFVLRIIDQMTMEQVAEATRVSLSTAKRRVNSARKRFNELAKKSPATNELLGGAR